MRMLWINFVLLSFNLSVVSARKIKFANSSMEFLQNIYKYYTTSTEKNSDPYKFTMPVCQDFNAYCIQHAAEYARQFLAHGIPSYGIQPLDPLQVSSMRLKQADPNNIEFTFDAWLSDVTMQGLTDYSFNKLDIDPEQSKATANISFPFLHITGDFMIAGRFQMLPIELIGQIIVNFTLCTAFIEAEGASFHTKMVVKHALVRLKCSDPVEADLNNAKSPSEEMELITDHIVLMHSNDVLKEIQPAVESALATLTEDIANKFLRQYS